MIGRVNDHSLHCHMTFGGRRDQTVALAFLLLIGVILIADGFGQPVPKGYVYFAMGFAVLVELLNIGARRATGTPVHLHQEYEEQKKA